MASWNGGKGQGGYGQRGQSYQSESTFQSNHGGYGRQLYQEERGYQASGKKFPPYQQNYYHDEAEWGNGQRFPQERGARGTKQQQAPIQELEPYVGSQKQQAPRVLTKDGKREAAPTTVDKEVTQRSDRPPVVQGTREAWGQAAFEPSSDCYDALFYLLEPLGGASLHKDLVELVLGVTGIETQTWKYFYFMDRIEHIMMSQMFGHEAPKPKRPLGQYPRVMATNQMIEYVFSKCLESGNKNLPWSESIFQKWATFIGVSVEDVPKHLQGVRSFTVVPHEGVHVKHDSFYKLQAPLAICQAADEGFKAGKESVSVAEISKRAAWDAHYRLEAGEILFYIDEFMKDDFEICIRKTKRPSKRVTEPVTVLPPRPENFIVESPTGVPDALTVPPRLKSEDQRDLQTIVTFILLSGYKEKRIPELVRRMHWDRKRKTKLKDYVKTFPQLFELIGDDLLILTPHYQATCTKFGLSTTAVHIRRQEDGDDNDSDSEPHDDTEQLATGDVPELWAKKNGLCYLDATRKESFDTSTLITEPAEQFTMPTKPADFVHKLGFEVVSWHSFMFDEGAGLKMMTLNFLKQQLKNKFGTKVDIYPFGSFTSGIVAFGGDVDLCIDMDTTDAKYNGEMDRRAVQRCIWQVSVMLQNSGLGRDVRPVLCAYVPIAKHESTKTNPKYCNFDLSLCYAGVRNSAFIWNYVKANKTLIPPLAVYIIMWSKHNSVNDSRNGFLTSYTVVLLILNYLLKARAISFISMEDHAKEPVHPTPKDSTLDPFHADFELLGRHVVGFFEYYNTFDFEKYVISLRVPHVNVLRSCKTPKCGWGPAFMHVEDPLEVHLNTCRNVTKDRFDIIRDRFAIALRTVREKGSLVGLFKPQFVSDFSGFMETTYYKSISDAYGEYQDSHRVRLSLEAL